MKTYSCRQKFTARIRPLFFLLLACCLRPGQFVDAASRYWTGANDNFNDSSNWYTGAMAGQDDIAELIPEIIAGVPTYRTPKLTADFTVRGFHFRPPNSQPGPAYTLTVPDSFSLNIGQSGIKNDYIYLQTFENTGTGAINLDNADVTGPVRLLNSGTGQINFTNSNVGLTTTDVTIDNASTGQINFVDGNVGAGTITNTGGGTLLFRGGSSTSGAAIVNDGLLDIGGLSNSGLEIGSVSGSGDIHLSSKALTMGGNNLSTEISGVISGTGGTLFKDGGGTLTLSGNNTYTGGTTVFSGRLAGNTSSLQGDINTDSTMARVEFNQATDGTYAGVMSGLGELVKTGTGTLTVAGNLSQEITSVLEGTLQGNSSSLHSIEIVVAPDASVHFSQATDGTYEHGLRGGGNVIKGGEGALTLSGVSGLFSGATTVNAGALNVTGFLPGTLTVAPAGTLSGTGEVGAVTNQGLVRPGVDGSGTLRAANYAGPGTLEIAFNEVLHTSLTVTNTADLAGGTLVLTGSQFTPGRYNVVTAFERKNEFAVTEGPVFLDFLTEYTTAEVQVVVNSLSFAGPAATENERAVGEALDSIQEGGGEVPATTFNALFQLKTAAQAQAAFREISGDALASFQDVGLRHGRLFTEGLTGRAVPMDSASTAALAGPAQLPIEGAGKAMNTPVMGATPSKGRGIWARAIGSFDRTDGDSSLGSPEASAQTGGFQAGYDHPLSDEALVGGSLGYARTGVDVDERSSSGDSSALALGIHGRYALKAWFFDAAAAYIRNSNEMTRTLDFAGSNADSSFTSPVYTAYMDAGYGFEPLPDTAVEPVLSMRISRFSQESFTESGAPGLNLQVDEQSVTSFVPGLGVRLTHLFMAESGHPFLLGGNLGFAFELGDTERELTAQFADAPGVSYSVQGTPQETTAFDLGINGRVALSENWQAFAGYGMTMASGRSSHGFLGGARLRW